VEAMKRSDWLLALIYLPGHTGRENEPMDRIRITKCLFLLGKEAGQQLSNFYEFTPYLYGPFTLDIYIDLGELQEKGLAQSRLLLPLNWCRYQLTAKGINEAHKVCGQIPPPVRTKMQELKKLVTELPFMELLRYVYKKYPEFATNSMIKVV
jgi:hypothetical protein